MASKVTDKKVVEWTKFPVGDTKARMEIQTLDVHML